MVVDQYDHRAKGEILAKLRESFEGRGYKVVARRVGKTFVVVASSEGESLNIVYEQSPYSDKMVIDFPTIFYAAGGDCEVKRKTTAAIMLLAGS